MRVLALDVLYNDTNNTAQIAGVLFEADSSVCISTYETTLSDIHPYIPGEFYRRELPCLTKLISMVDTPYDILCVDSYVDLEPGHKGLGRHLYEYFQGKYPVIGVAKTHFHDAEAVEVCRGESKKPLYVTSVGLEITEAVGIVEQMHGSYRIPTHLKKVDMLTRCPAV